MEKINVAIVHGIGVNKPGYAANLIKGIKKEFEIYIRKFTNVTAGDCIQFKEIIWDDILGENQEKLKKIFEDEFKRRDEVAGRDAWKRLAIFLVSVAIFLLLTSSVCWSLVFLVFAAAFMFGKKVVVQLRTGFAAEFVSDIIGYGNEDVYKGIFQRLEESLNEFTPENDKRAVTFISHSLGTVVSSNFVYDIQKKDMAPRLHFTLRNFFTMGSPLALFCLKRGPEMFKDPIHVEDDRARWINILDADDVIAYPLKSINNAYSAVVHKDLYIEAGLLGIAHIQYWNNKHVHKLIGSKLALDWLTVNQKLSNEKVIDLYTEYDTQT